MAPGFGRVLSRGRFPVLVTALLSLLVASGDVASGEPRGGRHQTRFTVEIEGMEAGRFLEVSGIGVETEVLEFRDGGSNDVRKVPGRTKWPPVILKRAFTGDTALYDWAMTNAATGSVVRRSVLVTDAYEGRVVRYKLTACWPKNWEGPTLSASGNDVAIETIELVHEGLSLEVDDP
jgi:phage tail-like protein